MLFSPDRSPDLDIVGGCGSLPAPNALALPAAFWKMELEPDPKLLPLL
jgi:hypothetical protein